MTQSLDRPPSGWIDDAVRISDEIYLSSSFDPDNDHPTVWHWCKALDRWEGQGTRNHTVVSREPWTLEPSIGIHISGCGCDLHGFITDGKWVPA